MAAMVIGHALPTAPAQATPEEAAQALVTLIGDRPTKSGRIQLKLPQIAENGDSVPLNLSVDSPMTPSDYVKSVHVLADGNPNPEVASFHFTPASGRAKIATLIRLAKTQRIIVVAEMSDGSLYKTTREIKVTIGGCGG